MRQRLKFVLSSVGVFLLGLIIIFGSYGWFLNKMKRVDAGTARPTFPYSDYSLAELNALYPQYLNVDTPTTRTPVETHRLFVNNLKAGNLDGAVECCFRQGDWEGMKEFFQGVKNRGMWNTMVSDITEIKPDTLLDTMATYEYAATLNGKKVANFIQFVKDSNGVWLIKSL